MSAGPCGGGYTARWQVSDELMQASSCGRQR
eukprot:CAMPEP_0177612174 /NCGR_PEP_ID=MMETSP0419_2-20121207/21032_1 /TAXON_ID=582737 /ORGANISM="Tetraselmis sp., Strain GSL018" /LENGTH=30 /DNA_ID= /DNA_START= /DNA_END= /DNA_ORIENTATION=